MCTISTYNVWIILYAYHIHQKRSLLRIYNYLVRVGFQIVPPLFGGISFPSGSFATGKRVLGDIFQFVPKEAVDFVLEINKDISSTSTKYFVMSGKWAVAGITERPFDSRLDIFVLFASGV